MLRLDHASLRYGAVEALLDCSVQFDQGSETVIVGRSGSGKTSLLKLASGLINATSGVVNSDDLNITELSENRRSAYRADRVGFVYQDYNLIDHLTVEQNVEMAWMLRQHHTSPRKAIEAVGLTHRVDHRPSELSGGEQQRVSIARAICGGPDIVFADEPTGALDDESTDLVIDTLRSLRNEFGVSLIVVTHDRTLAKTFDRIVTLVSGKVVSDESK